MCGLTSSRVEGIERGHKGSHQLVVELRIDGVIPLSIKYQDFPYLLWVRVRGWEKGSILLALFSSFGQHGSQVVFLADDEIPLIRRC